MLSLLRSTAVAFIDDEALSRGAAIAFYTATSIAPILLIVVAIAGLVFGRDAAEGAIITTTPGATALSIGHASRNSLRRRHRRSAPGSSAMVCQISQMPALRCPQTRRSTRDGPTGGRPRFGRLSRPLPVRFPLPPAPLAAHLFRSSTPKPSGA